MGILYGGNFSKKRVGSGAGGSFRDLYGVLFRAMHIMPDVLARQNPCILFRALDYEDEPSYEQEENEYIKMFYGG